MAKDQQSNVTDALPNDNGDTSKAPESINRLPDDTPRAPDPFDPVNLRLSQDFATQLGVKKELLTVPVKKPAKAWFVRTHPDEAYRVSTAVLELKEDRETYIVDQHLWSELASEALFSPRALITAINRQGVLFIWPIRLPDATGKINEWSRSALEAAGLAAQRWIRVSSNMSLVAYEVVSATGDLAEPEWPDLSFRDILSIAFKDRRISSLDHPVLQRLRGEQRSQPSTASAKSTWSISSFGRLTVNDRNPSAWWSASIARGG